MFLVLILVESQLFGARFVVTQFQTQPQQLARNRYWSHSPPSPSSNYFFLLESFCNRQIVVEYRLCNFSHGRNAVPLGTDTTTVAKNRHRCRSPPSYTQYPVPISFILIEAYQYWYVYMYRTRPGYRSHYHLASSPARVGSRTPLARAV